MHRFGTRGGQCSWEQPTHRALIRAVAVQGWLWGGNKGMRVPHGFTSVMWYGPGQPHQRDLGCARPPLCVEPSVWVKGRGEKNKDQ